MSHPRTSSPHLLTSHFYSSPPTWLEFSSPLSLLKFKNICLHAQIQYLHCSPFATKCVPKCEKQPFPPDSYLRNNVMNSIPVYKASIWVLWGFKDKWMNEWTHESNDSENDKGQRQHKQLMDSQASWRKLSQQGQRYVEAGQMKGEELNIQSCQWSGFYMSIALLQRSVNDSFMTNQSYELLRHFQGEAKWAELLCSAFNGLWEVPCNSKYEVNSSPTSIKCYENWSKPRSLDLLGKLGFVLNGSRKDPWDRMWKQTPGFWAALGKSAS